MAHGWGDAWGFNYGGDDELKVGSITASPIANTIAIAALGAGCAHISAGPSITVTAISGVTNE